MSQDAFGVNLQWLDWGWWIYEKFIQIFFPFQQASRLNESARNWHGCRPWAWCASSQQPRDWIWWTRREFCTFCFLIDLQDSFLRACFNVLRGRGCGKKAGIKEEWGTCCQARFAPFCSESRSNPAISGTRLEASEAFRKSLWLLWRRFPTIIGSPVEWSGDDVLLCEAGLDVREMISRCKGLSMWCRGLERKSELKNCTVSPGSWLKPLLIGPCHRSMQSKLPVRIFLLDHLRMYSSAHMFLLLRGMFLVAKRLGCPSGCKVGLWTWTLTLFVLLENWSQGRI